MPFIHRADAQQAFAECQARPWHSTMATHLEPSFRVGTNHPLFYGLLQLFLLVFFSFSAFIFFFFSFNRPQEGENCWSQPNTDLPLALGAKGHWAARFCKQRTTNVFGVLGPPCGTQALVLTPPLHGHPILAQCLTASSCEQGCSSHLSVSVLFLLLSSACFFIPKVTVQLNAHQLEP